MQMKPFTRGGTTNLHGYEKLKSGVLNNTMLETGFASLNLNPISQDLYITEYRPDLHHIILNKAIPHIKVALDGQELPTNMMEITQTASFQKLIHSAHVRNLTANPLDFCLFNPKPEDGERELFDQIKQEWMWRNCEWNKYMAINTCKQLGNCGLLFSYDKETGKYTMTNFSYEDGYQMTPNYDEYGNLEDYPDEYDGRFLAPHEEQIRNLIQRYDAMCKENLAEYFDGSNSAVAKLKEVHFGTQNVSGVLYGCIRAELTEPFTEAEEAEFLDWLEGQCSDGYGEGLEQRPIRTEDGDLYVSFWNGGDDYFLLGSDDFDAYLTDHKMGGM